MSMPRKEHPRPDRMRENWLNLNGAWRFTFSNDSKSPPTTKLDKIIQVPFSWACRLSGIEEDVKGGAWYQRTAAFEAPQGDRLILCIGAADYFTKVFINNRLVGQHTGGYGEFEFDITDFWTPNMENLLQIYVEDNDADTQTRGKQGYGETRGLWQTVWLEARPTPFIKAMRIITHLDGEILFAFDTSSTQKAQLPLILDFGENAYRSLQVVVPSGTATIEVTLRLSDEDTRLWSPDDPFLYEGSVSLGRDKVNTYFGIREITTGALPGKGFPSILLNGKPIYLNGTLDQSFNPDGFFTLPTEGDIIDEVKRLKSIGLNFVRIHIKPEEPRKLYWLDKLGLMVMEDMSCFWGEPTASARATWEAEALEILERDYNHPCIFSWVIFNETWGLTSPLGKGQRAYLPETQRWVANIYARFKDADPSRIIEDNSACKDDHVITDINTWHFYINGWDVVRDHVRKRVAEAYMGSHANFIGEHTSRDEPLMNSECGMVWGVDGNAGDSDLAWQYRYMLNEFRLHEKMCGFVFTEFHDVVNEWNGYYRINNDMKDFGYQDYVAGMSLADLHAPDFIVIDAPPCKTVGGGDIIDVPLVYSGFGEAALCEKLTVHWKLTYQGLDGAITADEDQFDFSPKGWGTTPLPTQRVAMPQSAALAVFGVSLLREGKVLARNFITFDVRGAMPGVSIRPKDYSHANWKLHWQALGGHKQNGGGSGSFTYHVDTSGLAASSARISFEAGAKRVLKKDTGDVDWAHDINFMHGYRQDPGANRNSYPMTCPTTHPSKVDVLIDGNLVATIDLPNDPADSRGALSWHYQETHRLLDEAGSYGYLCQVDIPADIMRSAHAKGAIELTLRVPESTNGGLALYGRNAGRYPIDIVVHNT